MATNKPATAQLDAPAPKSMTNVGAHLRKQRLAQNLTLVELSRKSGVSFATISKIETGKVSGGFQTIYKIARGLGILVTDILEPDLQQDQEVVVRRENDLKPHRTTLYDYYPQATRPRGRLNSSIMIIHTTKVPPRIDWSNHEGEEVVTVLSGAISLHLEGDEPRFLNAGDSACFNSGIPHAYVCTSPEPARIIFVSTRGSNL